MNSEVTFQELILKLQDYISQTKNCIISTLPDTIFQKKENNKGVASYIFTQDQLKQMQDIVNFVEKNDWILGMIEAFIETLPHCVTLYRKFANLDSPIKAAVLGQLVV
jgi:chorismate synthase